VSIFITVLIFFIPVACNRFRLQTLDVLVLKITLYNIVWNMNRFMRITENLLSDDYKKGIEIIKQYDLKDLPSSPSSYSVPSNGTTVKSTYPLEVTNERTTSHNHIPYNKVVHTKSHKNKTLNNIEFQQQVHVNNIPQPHLHKGHHIKSKNTSSEVRRKYPVSNEVVYNDQNNYNMSHSHRHDDDFLYSDEDSYSYSSSHSDYDDDDEYEDSNVDNYGYNGKYNNSDNKYTKEMNRHSKELNRHSSSNPYGIFQQYNEVNKIVTLRRRRNRHEYNMNQQQRHQHHTSSTKHNSHSPNNNNDANLNELISMKRGQDTPKQIHNFEKLSKTNRKYSSICFFSWKNRSYNERIIYLIDISRTLWILAICPIYLFTVIVILFWLGYYIRVNVTELSNTNRTVEMMDHLYNHRNTHSSYFIS